MSNVEDDESRVDAVHLSGVVVLKLIQHCRDRLPEIVTGQLLGLDRRDENGSCILEVTNSFPYFNQEEDEASDQPQLGGAEYQFEYMRCLREVNADYNAVGWYTSSVMGSYLSDAIESQFKFQDSIKKSILLVYDPLKTSQGTLAIRAFRLSPAFVELYKAQSFSKESMAHAGFTFDNIYTEIPVRVQNTHLINALLVELEEGTTADSEFERLSLAGTASYAERHVEYAVDTLDELSAEQNKYQFYMRNVQRQQAQQNAFIQKRKAENLIRVKNGEEPLPESDPNNPIFKALPEPVRLDSLVLENQIDLFCDQINKFSSQAVAKIHLVSGLM